MVEVPNPNDQKERDMVVFGVDFGEDYEVVRFRYMLTRNVSAGFAKDETVSIETAHLDQGDFADLVDAVIDLIDAASLYNRLEQEKAR